MVLKFHMRSLSNAHFSQSFRQSSTERIIVRQSERRIKLPRAANEIKEKFKKKIQIKNKIFITKYEITSKADLQHKNTLPHFYCLRLLREKIRI